VALFLRSKDAMGNHPEVAFGGIVLRKLSSPFLILQFISTFAYAATPPNVLSLGVAGVATPQPDTLAVAAPLANLTSRAVTSVKIDRIQLSTAKLRTTLPINLLSSA
jgi:hypothetical protein